jgi:hypothetical protein
MKQKQLEAITKQHRIYQETGKKSQPELSKFICLSLVSGRAPKLKPEAQILQTCRQKIVKSEYDSGRNLSFTDLFESCPEHTAALKEWEKEEKARLKRVADYLEVAEPLMRQAALNEDADAVQIATALFEAATNARLIASTADH